LSENKQQRLPLKKMIDFYNRDEKSLQRGMDWDFK
jgi:hypothetical protein